MWESVYYKTLCSANIVYSVLDISVVSDLFISQMEESTFEKENSPNKIQIQVSRALDGGAGTANP